MKIESGSRWERRDDGATVTVRDKFPMDSMFLGLMTIVEYSVIEPEWREKGYISPTVIGTCHDKAWSEHFVQMNEDAR